MQTIEIDMEPSNAPWLPLLPNAGKNGSSEPAIAYEAFQTYYTMAKRSLKKVAQKHGKSVKLIERWSCQFHWAERARRWDEHQGRFGNPENWNLVAHLRQFPRDANSRLDTGRRFEPSWTCANKIRERGGFIGSRPRENHSPSRSRIVQSYCFLRTLAR